MNSCCCACTYEDGKVTALCGAHHDVLKPYLKEIEDLKILVQKLLAPKPGEDINWSGRY